MHYRIKNWLIIKLITLCLLPTVIISIKITTQRDKLDGQQKPYKAGRKNIKVYTGIPHKPFTTVYNAEVGDGVEIKKIYGAGNGGFELALLKRPKAKYLLQLIMNLKSLFTKPTRTC